MDYSAYVVPLLLAFVALFALAKRVNVYEALTRGASQGLSILGSILPALVGLMTAVYMLRASGAMEALGQLLAPVLIRLGIPPETASLLLIRPVSGSGALAVGSDEGYIYVIDLDLSKFFDTVNHSKLLQILSRDIKDGRVISLIHKFLKAPVFENGKVGPKTTIGTPQGGCISPILANILLNELDQLLDSRGIRFVRYADDMVIMAKSQKAAERILGKVKDFLENKLFLKVNEQKTKIGIASEKSQFLGFAFTKRVSRQRKERNPRATWFATVHQKKRDKFQAKVREILDRRAPGGIDAVKLKLERYLVGWFMYYGNAVPPKWIGQVDQWIRRRIRQIYWKQWKTPQNRYRQIVNRWRKAPSIDEFAYSVNSYWRMARTPVIHKALGNITLWAEGWMTLEFALTTEQKQNHKVQ